jgi:RNA polymerase-binding transcription factor DksA
MTNPKGQVQATDALLPMPGMTWALLNAERQETCAALLSTSPRSDAHQMRREAVAEDEQQGLKRLEALQFKLCRIDRAMDQLMVGSYGHCRVCGGAIERKLLAADPALLECYSCQTGLEAEYPLQRM